MNYHEELKKLLKEQGEQYSTLEQELEESLRLSEALMSENRELQRSLQLSETTIKNSSVVIKNLEDELQKEKEFRSVALMKSKEVSESETQRWKELAIRLNNENKEQQALIERLTERLGR